MQSFIFALILAIIGIVLYILLATESFKPEPQIPFETIRSPSSLELSITPSVK